MKKLLFSVTASDCIFDVMRGSGPGGQKRNKTESKVRCTHKASGATAYSDKIRSQHDNKRDAFVKMANTQKFMTWHKMEVARRLGVLNDINEYIDKELAINILVEVKDEHGNWIKEK